jgi:uncharacterized membrane protein
MGHYRRTFRIAASVERVWEVLADPGRLPDWNGAFDRVEHATGRLDEPGTTYAQVMKVAGIELTGQWEITMVDRPHRRDFVGTPPGCRRCAGSDTFQKAEDGATLYTVEMDYALIGGALGVVLDRLFSRSFFENVIQNNVTQLRRILED